jgi:hypothetical protein
VTTARVFRASPLDALVLGAALAHGALLVATLSFAASPALGPAGRVALAALLGLAMNWSSNTVSHIHLHSPLFRGARANAAFALYLSALLAVPQSWWKLRHLEHHGLAPGGDERRALRRLGALELAALLAALAALVALAPAAFVFVYAPATLFGFALCANQGRAEHARAVEGVDVHGRVYNRLWFNDGFHAAHHRAPEVHWTNLPARVAPTDVVSPWPPLVRWLEELPALANRAAAAAIDALERATLRLSPVRAFLVATHARAFERLLGPVARASVHEVVIVGGGLFPRTALVLARLLPNARFTLVDAEPAHLAVARALLERDAPEAARRATYVAAVFDAARPPSPAPDLLVVPLAYRGDRERLYERPPAPLVAVHDWLWRARGRGARVSWLLGKRLNLVGARASR